MDFDFISDCEFSPGNCDHYIYAKNSSGKDLYSHSRLPRMAELITASVAAADISHDGILEIPGNDWFKIINHDPQNKIRKKTVQYDVRSVANLAEKNQFPLQNNTLSNQPHYHQELQFSLGVNSLAIRDVNADIDLPNLYGAEYGAIEAVPELERLASFTSKKPITISVNDVTVDENSGFAEFEISLSRAPGPDSVEFEYQTLDGSANSNQDYIAVSDLVILTDLSTSTRVFVAIVDDEEIEDTEAFGFEISSVVGATVEKSTAQAEIIDNDETLAQNMLTVSNVVMDEFEEEAIIRFVLSEPPGQTTVEFSYSTFEFASQGDMAVEGEDFVPQSGLIEFTGSETEKIIKIPVINDADIENPESFSIQITNLFGASIENSSAEVTINDDDTPSTIYLSVDEVSVDESVGVAIIKFLLSKPPGQKNVEFNFTTSNGTALDGIDYAGESGFRSMTNDTTERFISIPIFDDEESEGVETFTVEITNLVGAEIENPIVSTSIIDNDQISNTLAIRDVTVDEDAGVAVFTFILTQAPGLNMVEFNFSTQDGTAVDSQDFSGASGYRSMKGPTREMYLSIPILDDDSTESDEIFSLVLSNINGAVYEGEFPTATIKDND